MLYLRCFTSNAKNIVESVGIFQLYQLHQKDYGDILTHYLIAIREFWKGSSYYEVFLSHYEIGIGTGNLTTMTYFAEYKKSSRVRLYLC